MDRKLIRGEVDCLMVLMFQIFFFFFFCLTIVEKSVTVFYSGKKSLQFLNAVIV